jgi:hypothetical protein
LTRVSTVRYVLVPGTAFSESTIHHVKIRLQGVRASDEHGILGLHRGKDLFWNLKRNVKKMKKNAR